jgi:hypothetical protein
MLVTIAVAFLVLMAAIALYGRLRRPGGPPRITTAQKCPRCGSYRIGRGPCGCGGPGAG